MEDALLPPEQKVARSNRAGRTIAFNNLRLIKRLVCKPLSTRMSTRNRIL